jgi:hypothetical protein
LVTKTGYRTDRGGIRTLEDLRIRCHYDEDTGCWNWRGAAGKKGRSTAAPRCWLADEGKSVLVARAAWMLGRQANLQPTDTVWRRCRNDLCCNPQHLLRGDKAAWGEWVGRAGYLRGRPERSAMSRRLRQAQGNVRVTQEIAQWVRESGQKGRDIAHAIGESDQLVCKIRKGQTHRPHQAFSVFSWGGA